MRPERSRSPTASCGGEAGDLNSESALSRNDAYNFFAAIDDLFVPGPTGTNVADIFIGLVNY